MNVLLDSLITDAPTVCVSLLDNDVGLARAAVDAGADGLKLHANLVHGPTGRTLGSIEREADRMRAVIEAVDVPVGVVPRGRPGTTRAEVERLRDLGFDFVDLYGKHTNPSTLGVPGITTWVAPTSDYDTEMLRVLARRDDVHVIEAAFFPVDVFGSPLTLDDLVRLEIGLEAIAPSGTPVVLPTDRKLEEHDLASLHAIGIRNYLLGFTVTGDRPDTIAAATSAFAQALRRL